MDAKENVIAWLNDAYGMENALVQVLEHRVKDAEGYPEIQAKDQQHLELTRQHATRVQGCIERLGGKTSAVKSALATLFGQMQAPMTGLARDELVKNFLTDYAAEQFEVASYTALIAAASQGGDQETVAVCEQNRREDQEMATWLLQHLPMVAQDQVQHLVENAAR